MHASRLCDLRGEVHLLRSRAAGMLISSRILGVEGLANLVLVDKPALVFFIPAVMTATVFDDLVDG